MKLLVSESEKNRILGMHQKVRKMLFEALSEDVANWDNQNNFFVKFMIVHHLI